MVTVISMGILCPWKHSNTLRYSDCGRKAKLSSYEVFSSNWPFIWRSYHVFSVKRNISKRPLCYIIGPRNQAPVRRRQHALSSMKTGVWSRDRVCFRTVKCSHDQHQLEKPINELRRRRSLTRSITKALARSASHVARFSALIHFGVKTHL